MSNYPITQLLNYSITQLLMKTVISSQIWQALESVKDPEIPVVSAVEMGIVRGV